MFDAYSQSLGALWFILIMILVQAQVAMRVHRQQKEMIPGVLDPHLGHESFVFRSDRTFRKSLENIILQKHCLYGGWQKNKRWHKQTVSRMPFNRDSGRKHIDFVLDHAVLLKRLYFGKVSHSDI